MTDFVEISQECRENIQPQKVQPLVDEIIETDKKWLSAALLQEFVYDIIEFDNSYSNLGRGPVETFKDKKGNCTDQCVLLASMFKAVNLNTELWAVQNQNGDNHMVVNVAIPEINGILYDKLKNHYQNDGLVDGVGEEYFESLDIGFYEEDGYNWFICDPTSSWILGYLGGLVKDGYIRVSDTGFEFKEEGLRFNV